MLAVIAGALWVAVDHPRCDRQWVAQQAVMARADLRGDSVYVSHVRNFSYTAEEVFTPAYDDRRYDLNKLESVWFIVTPFSKRWRGPAHTFVSFGFADSQYVAISVEARREPGETYGPLTGLFRQFELIYVVGDERDLIRVRTNYRQDPPEDVYLYRVRAPIENARRLFLEYVRAINELAERPRFYDTLTTNCTTTILLNTRVNPGHLPLSWKVLLSGHAAEYAYEWKRLDTSMPFPELQRRSRINEAARAADQATDFSRRIRAGLPGIDGS